MRFVTTVVLGLFAALAVAPAEARSSGGYHHVRSYTTHRGTHVQSHHRTNPNHTRSDNWSTRGNRNPFTGRAGTKSPWRR